MKIAVITGASSGMGREFAIQLSHEANFDEMWVIARRKEALESLKDQVCCPIRPIAMDLLNPDSFQRYADLLDMVQPEIKVLVNCAGCGYLGELGQGHTDQQTRMIDLNLRALTAVTDLVLPYMGPGGRILNVSSIASFCPTPRMTVYGATKSYVSAFTVGLSEEVRRRGITVTAVCPGPMRTEFLDVGGITGNSRAFAMLPYCDQVRVAGGALRAARTGQTFYTPRLFYKFYRVLAKVTPVKLMVKFTKT